jgi:dihydroorotate dehydrogenase
MNEPFYNPEKSYEENFKDGPYGPFRDGVVLENKNSKKFDFLGLKVNSSFGIPAGPLLNGNFIKGALDKGFDLVTYKTVRSQEHPSHPWPNVLSVKIEGDLTLEKAKGKLVASTDYQEPISITNSFGVPSRAKEFWQKDLQDAIKYARDGQVVIGSFQGTKMEGQTGLEYVNDYRVTAKMLLETGVKIMEVNLSCPNEGTNNLLCFDTNRSVEVAKAIRETIGGIPLIIKIAYFESDEELRSLVKKINPYIDAISAINTIPALIVDKDGNQALPGEGRERSGVCGHAIKWAGLDMARRLKKIREDIGCDYTIIGVGGVLSPEDFFEYIEAGADAVMSATGAMWNPYLANEIKEKLS